MKKWPALVIATTLLTASLAGCSSDTTDEQTNTGAGVEVVEGGEGSSPETALPFGASYLLPDGVEVLISSPVEETLTGFTADSVDLSIGDPTGLTFTFVNRNTEDVTSDGGVFVDLKSRGEQAQVVLEGDANRVFHAGLPESFTEGELNHMVPFVLKPNKPYTFQVIFIPADPNDMTLAMSGGVTEPIYFFTTE